MRRDKDNSRRVHTLLRLLVGHIRILQRILQETATDTNEWIIEWIELRIVTTLVALAASEMVQDNERCHEHEQHDADHVGGVARARHRRTIAQDTLAIGRLPRA